MRVFQVYYWPKAKEWLFATDALAKAFVITACDDFGADERDFFYDEKDVIEDTDMFDLDSYF